MDPLAEKYPGWTPYHYVHNNPTNMVDPTGMEGEGWIETNSERTNNTQLTYDAEVNTIDEAVRKGYKNVKNVENYKIYASENGSEYLSLNKDGSVTDLLNEKTIDVGFNPIRTSDGTYIVENNGLKQTSQALQAGGDNFTYLGLAFSITGVSAPVGGVLMTAGGFINLSGTTIEAVYMMAQGKFWQGVNKLFISGLFLGTGKAGEYGLEKAYGKKAIEEGLYKSSETLIQGTNTILEKTVGKSTEDYINEKIK